MNDRPSFRFSYLHMLQVGGRHCISPGQSILTESPHTHRLGLAHFGRPYASGSMRPGWRVTSPDGRMRTMTRADLIAAIASRFPTLTAKDADIAVREVLDAIGQSLVQGDRVEIRGFGSFSLNYRPPRKGRNPKSGESVSVPAKHVPHFKAGKEMRVRVEESAKSAPLQQAA